MTKGEAIQAMREGKRVTHKYFAKGEWATMKDENIVLEDGVVCSQYEFWMFRDAAYFHDGWEIYKD